MADASKILAAVLPPPLARKRASASVKQAR